jgi:hypothetical protein
MQYSSTKYKDKIIAHAVRAIGYIFTNCEDLKVFDDHKDFKWQDLFNTLIDNIAHKTPKVSWNVCVVLRLIMDNDKIKSQIQKLLFSDKTIQSL